VVWASKSGFHVPHRNRTLLGDTVEMAATNPYQSPIGCSRSRATATNLLPNVFVAIVLSASGLLVLLVLDGQHFRNALISLLLLGMSSLIWLRLLFARRRSRLLPCVLALHAALVIILLVQLPARYTDQAAFNAAVTRLQNLGHVKRGK
jgi:hypothetical protein